VKNFEEELTLVLLLSRSIYPAAFCIEKKFIPLLLSLSSFVLWESSMVAVALPAAATAAVLVALSAALSSAAAAVSEEAPSTAVLFEAAVAATFPTVPLCCLVLLI
jgi:hypothetical protein